MLKNPKKSFKAKLGFSLLELLIVLTLVAILSLAGVRSWHFFLKKQQQQILVNQLQQSLNFAKQSAVAYHQAVSLCAAASDQMCGDNWSKGILIFLNSNGQSQPQDHLLLRVPPLSKTAIIQWRGWLTSPQIRFEADGLPHGYHGSFYWIQDD
jgi:type IV fimbrial biogenesis protein FimT